MIFVLSTLLALAVVYICTPAPKPVQPKYQHRHPEAGPMQKRPTQRRTVRLED